MSDIYKYLSLLFLAVVLPPLTYASSLYEECVKIAEDRKRLECFDEVFQTPIHSFINQNELKGLEKYKPGEWLDISEKEQQRKNSEEGFLVSISPGNFIESVVLTRPVDDVGTLVLSCIDKISRVELMLNEPVTEGIIPITIEGLSKNQENWLSDDSGYILRVGRGIPSINVMKNMLKKPNIILQLNEFNVVIPVDDLDVKIKKIREICRW